MDEKDSVSDPTPAPTAAWKKSCSECILPPVSQSTHEHPLIWHLAHNELIITSSFIPKEMSRTTRENIFCQASFQKEVWCHATTVMNMYEQGKLKDQKLSQENLTTTPEVKQHFLPLHHLDPDY